MMLSSNKQKFKKNRPRSNAVNDLWGSSNEPSMPNLNASATTSGKAKANAACGKRRRDDDSSEQTPLLNNAPHERNNNRWPNLFCCCSHKQPKRSDSDSPTSPRSRSPSL